MLPNHPSHLEPYFQRSHLFPLLSALLSAASGMVPNHPLFDEQRGVSAVRLRNVEAPVCLCGGSADTDTGMAQR